MPDTDPTTNGKLLIRIDERTKRIDKKLDEVCEAWQEGHADHEKRINDNRNEITKHEERLGVINKLGGAIGLGSLGAIITSVWGKIF